MKSDIPSSLHGEYSPEVAGRRVRHVMVAAVALLALLVFPTIQIQLFQHESWLKLSNKEVQQTVTVSALRGGIYDRYGAILAVSSPATEVVADDFLIKHPRQMAQQITRYLHIKVPRLTRMLSRKSGYVILRSDLPVRDGRALQRLALNGLDFYSSYARSSPNGMLARSVLGYINASGKGSAGLEYQYEHLLAGQAGKQEVLQTNHQTNLPTSNVRVLQKSVPGKALELTIDAALQFITEQTLAKQIRSTGAYTGVAMVMDVRTGEILANASLVNKNVKPNPLTPVTNWGGDVGVAGVAQTIMNLGVSQVYEPGSVFKIVPFSAALQVGAVSPSTRFSVPYQVQVGTRTIHDAERHGVQNMSVQDILTQSSNIGTYLISRQVGSTGLLAQVNQLGFGQTTNLHYPGESAGLLKTAATWVPSDMASLPIGQVDAVTPLQVLDAYNAIANHGVFVEPKLVRATIDANGLITATPKSATHRALSPSVAAQLTGMLHHVVTSGTGTLAGVPGYSVAGKTGTSQIPVPGSAAYITGAYDASFVGFAPADHPILSMIVIVQRPRTAIFGGSIAAPVFQRVMAYALHHYNIPTTSNIVAPQAPGKTSLQSDVT